MSNSPLFSAFLSLNIFIAKYSIFYVILFITIASVNIKQYKTRKKIMPHCVIAALLILCRNAAPILQRHGLWTQTAIPRWWSGKSNCYLTFIFQLLIFTYEIQLKFYVIMCTDVFQWTHFFFISNTMFVDVVSYSLFGCFLFMCMFLYFMCEDVNTGVHWVKGQKRGPDLLEIELDLDLSCLLGVLGLKLGLAAWVWSAFSCWAIFQHPDFPLIRIICPLQTDAVYLNCDVEKT